MPIPIHLICSESGAVDEPTGRASYFNLVEKLRFARAQPVPGQLAMARVTTLRVSAYWMKEDGDLPDTVFEAQFVAILPNAPQEIELARANFRFSGQFQRLNVIGVQLTQFFGPGILYIEARLRREGEQSWQVRMSYPILVEEVELPPLTMPAAPVNPALPPPTT